MNRRFWSTLCLCISVWAVSASGDTSQCHDHASDNCEWQKPRSGIVMDLQDLPRQNIPGDLYAGNSTVAGYGLFSNWHFQPGEVIYRASGVLVRKVALPDGKKLVWYLDRGKPVLLDQLGQDVLWFDDYYQTAKSDLSIIRELAGTREPFLETGVLDLNAVMYLNDSAFCPQHSYSKFGVKVDTEEVLVNPNVDWLPDQWSENFILQNKHYSSSGVENCLEAGYPLEFCIPDELFSLATLPHRLEEPVLIALTGIEPGTELLFDYEDSEICQIRPVKRYEDDTDRYETHLERYRPLIDFIEEQIRANMSGGGEIRSY